MHHLSIKRQARLGILCLLLLIQISVKAQETRSPELLVQNGHTGTITALAYNPDSTLIASGSEDDTIKLWSVRSGYLTRTLTGHSGPILALAFSPDGSLLVSGSKDGTLRLWNVVSGEFLRDFKGHTSQINSVAFSPTGELIASASGWYGDQTDNSVRLWNPKNGVLVKELIKHEDRISSVVFSPDGTTLASGDRTGSIEVWNVDSGKLITTLLNVKQVTVNGRVRSVPIEINAVQFSPDGQALAAISGRAIRIWDPKTARVLRELNVESNFAQATFSPDWSTIAAPGTYSEKIKMLDAEDGRQTRILNESDPITSALVFSPDGKLLAAGSSDERIKVWDVRTSRLLHSFNNNSGNVTSISYSPKGGMIAWSRGERVELWDAKKGEMLRMFQAESFVNSLAFSPNERLLAAGTAENGIQLWSIPDGRVINTPVPTGLAQAVAFNPNGRILASGSSDENDNLLVSLWDLKSSSFLRKLMIPSPYKKAAAQTKSRKLLLAHAPTPGPDLTVFSIAFSRDGRRIAAGSSFEGISVWNAVNGKPLHTLKGHNFSVTSVAFSPDGRMIVSSGTNIKLWSADTGMLINTFEPHTDYINEVVFSPDGKSIASASNDRTVKVLSVAKGAVVASLEDHASGANCVSFSPNGEFLASGSIDATSRIWSIKARRLLSTVIAFNDGNWIAYTPDSFYNATTGAGKYIAWRDQGEIYSDPRYKPRFFQPQTVMNRSLGLLALPPITDQPKNIPVMKTEAVVLSTGEESLIRDWGPIQYYALVIGETAYQSRIFAGLTTPSKNAAGVAKILEENFSFKVERLPNATRKQILDAIDRYRRRADIDNNASLLIYYAGHGAYEEDTEVAYWQPVDAEPDAPSTWISSDDVVNRVRGMNARHVLIISDSCFSGGFFESTLGGQTQLPQPIVYLDRSMKRPSRLVMTAGEKEYVDALGPDGHSIFTFAFLQGLRDELNNVFTAEHLFYEYVQKYVISNKKYKTSQTPLFGPIPTSGRNRSNLGNFVFIRKR